jgi:hypothetical protein
MSPWTHGINEASSVHGSMDSRGHDKRRCVFLSLRCVALARPLMFPILPSLLFQRLSPFGVWPSGGAGGEY